MLGIIDCGIGNIRSLRNAFAFIGVDVVVASDYQKLDTCSGLVLPGVGAFPAAMSTLKDTGFDRYIKQSVGQKPLLGICLGMQLLLDTSDEFGQTDGLGLIPGKVTRLPVAGGVVLPHIGWTRVDWRNHNAGDIHRRQQHPQEFYFVHTFAAQTESSDHVLATAQYQGCEFAAAVCNGHVIGVQFHP